MLGANVGGNAGRDARAGENDAAIARELANLRRGRVLGRNERREDDDLGSNPPGSVDDRLDRRVGAEKGDTPAVIAKREREHDEPEIVLVSGRSREQSVPAGAATPAATEREEAAP